MRRRAAVAANPILVGAVTILVTVVAVFLAYNANAGLPFVPTYEVSVDLPDAAELVVGNDVRVGGTRVGAVSEIEARPAQDRRSVLARVTVKVDTGLDPLPDDSRAIVRQRSNLGLKYLELIPGASSDGVPAGGTLALDRAIGVVGFDDALSAFDPPTRTALTGVIRELGAGFAGRGPDLNRALEAFPSALPSLEVVAATLRAPATELPGFLRGADAAMRTLEPVTDELQAVFSDGATTFDAIAAEDASTDTLLRTLPAVERSGVAGFRAARRTFGPTRRLLRAAAPGVAALADTAPRITAGLRTSGPVVEDAEPTVRRLGSTLNRLAVLSRRPSVPASLDRLGATATALDSALDVIEPFQTRCNYLGLWGRNVPDVISEGDAMGTWFRFIPIAEPGEILQSAEPSPRLHANPDPETGANGECEPGNETYVPGQQIGNVPGTQPGSTQDTRPPEDLG